jgi:hypothetical protein
VRTDRHCCSAGSMDDRQVSTTDLTTTCTVRASVYTHAHTHTRTHARTHTHTHTHTPPLSTLGAYDHFAPLTVSDFERLAAFSRSDVHAMCTPGQRSLAQSAPVAIRRRISPTGAPSFTPLLLKVICLRQVTVRHLGSDDILMLVFVGAA